MSKRSGSALFLMEQLIVIMIFAVCASACVKIFVSAYLTTTQSKEISNALLTAQSGAECYKAVGGDTAQVADILGGERKDSAGLNTVYVYYNTAWQVCAEAEAAYTLVFSAQPLPTEPFAPLFADLSVHKSGGGELIAFTVAAGGKWDE